MDSIPSSSGPHRPAPQLPPGTQGYPLEYLMVDPDHTSILRDRTISEPSDFSITQCADIKGSANFEKHPQSTDMATKIGQILELNGIHLDDPTATYKIYANRVDIHRNGDVESRYFDTPVAEIRGSEAPEETVDVSREARLIRDLHQLASDVNDVAQESFSRRSSISSENDDEDALSSISETESEASYDSALESDDGAGVYPLGFTEQTKVEKRESTPPEEEQVLVVIQGSESPGRVHEIQRGAEEEIFAFAPPFLDVVSNYSQGNMPEDYDGPSGKKACAAICCEAMKAFASEKPLAKQEEIVNLMKDGIAAHHNLFKKDEYRFLGDVLGKLGVDEMGLEPYTLDSNPLENDESVVEARIASPLQIPYGGKQPQLSKLLKAARAENENLCVGITCNEETLLVMIPADENRPMKIFDSHGRPYQGEDKGASLLAFDKIDSLSDHLTQNVFKRDQLDFSALILRKKDALPGAAPQESRNEMLEGAASEAKKMAEKAALHKKMNALLKENFLELFGIDKANQEELEEWLNPETRGIQASEENSLESINQRLALAINLVATSEESEADFKAYQDNIAALPKKALTFTDLAVLELSEYTPAAPKEESIPSVSSEAIRKRGRRAKSERAPRPTRAAPPPPGVTTTGIEHTAFVKDDDTGSVIGDSPTGIDETAFIQDDIDSIVDDEDDEDDEKTEVIESLSNKDKKTLIAHSTSSEGPKAFIAEVTARGEAQSVSLANHIGSILRAQFEPYQREIILSYIEHLYELHEAGASPSSVEQNIVDRYYEGLEDRAIRNAESESDTEISDREKKLLISKKGFATSTSLGAEFTETEGVAPTSLAAEDFEGDTFYDDDGEGDNFFPPDD